MKAPRLALALASLLFCGFQTATPSTEKNQRAAAACVLAYGHTPRQAGSHAFDPATSASIADLIEQARLTLRSDPALKSAVATAAFRDALGRAPSADELRAEQSADRTYSETVARLVSSLAADPAEYARVINRAYRFALHRDIYPGEVAYWKSHDTFSYAFAVAILESWARRNQPGLMETSGDPIVSVNSDFLVTEALSVSVAAEAFAAAKLRPPSEAPDPFASGRNIVAAGAGDAISLGHICFAAAGNAALRSDPVQP